MGAESSHTALCCIVYKVEECLARSPQLCCYTPCSLLRSANYCKLLHHPSMTTARVMASTAVVVQAIRNIVATTTCARASTTTRNAAALMVITVPAARQSARTAPTIPLCRAPKPRLPTLQMVAVPQTPAASSAAGTGTAPVHQGTRAPASLVGVGGTVA